MRTPTRDDSASPSRRRPGATAAAGLLAAALSALAPLPPADAQQAAGHWPQWRGPRRDGVSAETGLLAAWPRGGPRKLWDAAGLGAGFSSLAVTGGRILTMGDRRDGQYVVALEEQTGRSLWATRVGGRYVDQYAGPRGTPTVDGSAVFVLTTDGDLVALDAPTGAVRWRRSLPRDFGAPVPNWRFAESPLVDGDRVLVAPGTRRAAIVALRRETGEEIWRAATPGLGASGLDGPEYSSIVVSRGGGVKQYVRLLGRGVVSVRADDGTYLWHYNRVANDVANIPTPIVSGDLVFASTGYQTGAALLEILPQPENRAAVRQRYFLEARTFQNHHGGMVLLDGHVYAGTGHNRGTPICIELATGRVVWGGDIRNAGEGSAAVAAADGHLYMRYQNGMMLLVEASPRGYREKGSFEIPDVRQPSWSHPVVAGGRLYLREQDALHTYDVRR